MEMLGLNIESIIQPVIDIGCGKKAALVKLLREQGVEAYGIDEDVIPEEHLIRADYMDYTFEPGNVRDDHIAYGIFQ